MEAGGLGPLGFCMSVRLAGIFFMFCSVRKGREHSHGIVLLQRVDKLCVGRARLGRGSGTPWSCG